LLLLLSMNSSPMGLLAPAMDLLPMVSHSLDMGADVVALVRVLLALHAISMDRKNWQRMIELAGNLNSVGVRLRHNRG
jgi:uncharacterized membrane protein